MDHLEKQLILKPLMLLHLGKLTTLLLPFTKLNLDLYQETKRPYFIAGMATITFLFMQMINTFQPLFHLGDTSATKLYHQDT